MTVYEEDGVDSWKRARKQEIGARKFSEEATVCCFVRGIRPLPLATHCFLERTERFLRQNMLVHIVTRRYQDLPGRIRRLCGQHANPRAARLLYRLFRSRMHSLHPLLVKETKCVVLKITRLYRERCSAKSDGG